MPELTFLFNYIRKEFLTMTEAEKSYLAGIIDGEGSIMLLRFHKKQFPSPCISIASISLELLEWVKMKTCVGFIKSKKNYKPDKHENSFTYTARYNDALYILEAIEPFLVIPQKKSRSKIILDEYKLLTPQNGRYTSEQKTAKVDFYARFLAL